MQVDVAQRNDAIHPLLDVHRHRAQPLDMEGDRAADVQRRQHRRRGDEADVARPAPTFRHVDLIQRSST